jgi:Vacuolar protein sorting-associated protein 62
LACHPSTLASEYVQTYSEAITSTVPADECDGSNYVTKGIRRAYWRLTLIGDSVEYVCQWIHFHPRTIDGQVFRSRDDWFYALPFRSGRPPLDTYLRLDVVDYDAMLLRHAPVWAFDVDEDFYPQRTNAFVESWVTDQFGSWTIAAANALFDGDGQRLAVAGAPSESGYRMLTTGMLGTSYLFSPENAPAAGDGDYLDARGSDLTTYRFDAERQRNNGYGDIVYARVVEGTDSTTWLQYWVFYYYNSFRHWTKGEHEGDWEMVQVGVDPVTKEPAKVTFANHSGAEACTWGQITKGDPAAQRPVVYVAADSHASYPRAGTTDLPFGAQDQHLGGGDWRIPPVEVIATTNPRWTTWPGRWGSSIGEGAPGNGEFKSPMSISKQGPKWSDPSAFHAAASPCSVGG